MKTKSSSIWTQSPCTLAFPEHTALFEKEDRFSLHSIYHKQKFHLKLKFKLQIMRPESCLIEFRRQIHDSQKYARKFSFKIKPINLQAKPDQLEVNASIAPSQFQQQIIERLTPCQPIKLDRIFDRNGMRSTFYETEGQEKIRYSFKKSKSFQGIINRNVKGPKVYVSGSIRIDLSKPQNFNPGPGSYFLDKRDNEQISQLYNRAHKSTNKKMNIKIETHKSSKASQNNILAKEKKIQQKSRLTRMSTSTKSKTQFTFFNMN